MFIRPASLGAGTWTDIISFTRMQNKSDESFHSLGPIRLEPWIAAPLSLSGQENRLTWAIAFAVSIAGLCLTAVGQSPDFADFGLEQAGLKLSARLANLAEIVRASSP